MQHSHKTEDDCMSYYRLTSIAGVSGLVGTTRGACDVSDIDKCAQAIASSLANPPNLLTLTLDTYTALCKYVYPLSERLHH